MTVACSVFARDQVEVMGHVELRTIFSDGTSSRTINSKYLVVNVVSAYNMLLGRPSLNRLGVVASTRHMNMKLPSLEGGVIVIKSDQKAARKCYENSLKSIRGYVRSPSKHMDLIRPPERNPPAKGDLILLVRFRRKRLKGRSSSSAHR